MGKKKEHKDRTLVEKIKFYTTFTAASLAICTFSLFLFLIPFVIDPTVATINQEFIEDPVECRVVLNRYILGESFRDRKCPVGFFNINTVASLKGHIINSWSNKCIFIVFIMTKEIEIESMLVFPC